MHESSTLNGERAYIDTERETARGEGERAIQEASKAKTQKKKIPLTSPRALTATFLLAAEGERAAAAVTTREALLLLAVAALHVRAEQVWMRIKSSFVAEQRWEEKKRNARK